MPSRTKPTNLFRNKGPMVRGDRRHGQGLRNSDPTDVRGNAEDDPLLAGADLSCSSAPLR